MPQQQKTEREPHPKGPIFVPKSIGFGYTLNFARWESFVIIGVIVLLVIAHWLYRKGEIKF